MQPMLLLLIRSLFYNQVVILIRSLFYNQCVILQRLRHEVNMSEVLWVRKAYAV